MVKMGFQPNVVGEAINVGPDEEFISVNELARRIAKLMNFQPLKPVYVEDRPMEVKFASCSAEKSRKLLGYKTTHTLDEGLEEMVKWIKDRGSRPFQYHLPLEIINDKTPVTWKNRLF